MKILLFGVSNVGKTTIGKLLAEKIKFSFYDLDEEIKKYYGITLEEFVHTENLRWRDQKEGILLKKFLNWMKIWFLQLRLFLTLRILKSV